MAAPFGFSVGDCIAGIKLLKDVVGAFNETRGAQASYQELSQELASLQSALGGIRDMKYGPEQEKQYETIVDAAKGCQQCLDHFVTRVSKFKDLLAVPEASRWSSSAFKRNIQKIEWSLCRTSDVDQFRKEVQTHKVTILSVQATFMRYGHSHEISLYLTTTQCTSNRTQKPESPDP
jgi:hypothetical protein